MLKKAQLSNEFQFLSDTSYLEITDDMKTTLCNHNKLQNLFIFKNYQLHTVKFMYLLQ